MVLEGRKEGRKEGTRGLNVPSRYGLLWGICNTRGEGVLNIHAKNTDSGQVTCKPYYMGVSTNRGTPYVPR